MITKKSIIVLMVGSLLTFSFTVFAKDCPKDLGFVEVKQQKQSCLYKEYSKNGNLTVSGKFENGEKRGKWTWTSYYFKDKNWKNNKHYANVNRDSELIDRMLNQKYVLQEHKGNQKYVLQEHKGKQTRAVLLPIYREEKLPEESGKIQSVNNP